YFALSELARQRLSLGESLALTLVQLDYCARIGAWPAMFQSAARKLPLIELMGPAASAKSQALLALAAKKTGRSDWEGWLRHRAELLTNVNELVAHRPILAELWPARTDI